MFAQDKLGLSVYRDLKPLPCSSVPQLEVIQLISLPPQQTRMVNLQLVGSALLRLEDPTVIYTLVVNRKLNSNLSVIHTEVTAAELTTSRGALRLAVSNKHPNTAQTMEVGTVVGFLTTDPTSATDEVEL